MEAGKKRLNGNMWTADNPVLKYKINLTKTKNLNQANQQLKVFPNPANQVVTIECPENKGRLSIYNMFGFEIWSHHISQNECKISLDRFIPGLYEVVWISWANKGRASLLIVE